MEKPEKALEVEPARDGVVLRVTLIDQPLTTSEPITLRFGLQATPVKPVSFAWRAEHRIYHGITYASVEPGPDGKTQLDALKEAGVTTVVYHQSWSQHYGEVTPSDDQALRTLIDACHQRGLKLLLYIGYGVGRNAPELQGHHDDWSVMPLIPWETTDHPELQNFDATCARSGWSDWLVQGIDKLFTDYALDGLYFDGTTEALPCQNGRHGCGWTDQEGTTRETFPIVAVRRMMRHLYDAVHRHRPDAIFDAHMSASLTMPTLSFCDSYWDGEQYENYTAKDKVEIPLDAFRTEFMGWAHGLDGEFLCYENRPFTFDEAIAIAWLHGVEVRPLDAAELATVSGIWHAMDRFGATGATWLPYWQDSGIAARDDTVKASTFAKAGKALLFVSHVRRSPTTTALKLDRRRLGLSAAALTCTDAITGKPVELSADGAIPVQFGGIGWRLLEVK